MVVGIRAEIIPAGAMAVTLQRRPAVRVPDAPTRYADDRGVTAMFDLSGNWPIAGGKRLVQDGHIRRY